MSEEKGTYQVTGKKTFKEILDSPEMEECRKAIAEAEKQYAKEAENWWNDLPYEDQLKAFFYVTSKLYESDVKEQGTYRYFLYDKMNFGPEAYSLGMQSGYHVLHNLLFEGCEFNNMRKANSIEVQSELGYDTFTVPKDNTINFVFDEAIGKLTIKIEPALWGRSEK